MKTSVCVCTYNGEKYIKEQLLSIVDQSIAVGEIIICDDGSTDDTLTIAMAVLEMSPIQYLIEKNEKRLGITKNFEKAISLAQGDIIFLSDQDDIWREDKVAKHLEAYRTNDNANLVFSDATLFDEKGELKDSCWERFGFERKKRRVYYKSQMQALLIGWYVTGATMSIRRSFVTQHMPFSELLLHDMYLSYMAAQSDSMVALSDRLTRYRQHREQVVGAIKVNIHQAITTEVDYDQQEKILNDMENYSTTEKTKELILLKKEYLERRRTIVSKVFPKRVILALSSLIRGRYNMFSNSPLKSMAKDVINKN